MLTSNQKKFIRILKELGIYKRWLDNRRNYYRMCMNILNGKYSIKPEELPDSPYFSFMLARSFVWSGTKEWNMWNRLHGKTATEGNSPYVFASGFSLNLLTHDEILDSDTIMKDLKQIVDEELHG